MLINRSSGCEHRRKYPKAARISGKRSRSAWTWKLNKPCAEKAKGTEDEVNVETESLRWTERSASNAELTGQANPVQRSSRCDRKQRHGWIPTRRNLESQLRHQLQYHHYSRRMQDAAPLEVACRALVRDESDTGLRMIVTWRVTKVAIVIISAESITDVKTCNTVRTASDEEVQHSSSKSC